MFGICKNASASFGPMSVMTSPIGEGRPMVRQTKKGDESAGEEKGRERGDESQYPATNLATPKELWDPGNEKDSPALATTTSNLSVTFLTSSTACLLLSSSSAISLITWTLGCFFVMSFSSVALAGSRAPAKMTAEGVRSRNAVTRRRPMPRFAPETEEVGAVKIVSEHKSQQGKR
ncbi:hypothetical protein QFC19_005136 [Naganishia cerealis]|uniref:Uncharacterized protein n=1 Tax=Naganishia cerealis TaxID=610337 RepID=A0ACC2VPW8_9TREE|nr:hypothetical protein QFC19_005136 [Naganishia cerealis]